jgi:4-amino-4-deoxy-L-arabinose transferase-like glycosyltransferase
MEPGQEAGRNHRIALALAGLYWAFLALTLSLNNLVGLDEMNYASIARQASQEGHWFPLYWHGSPFFDKPPLMIWLMALAAKLWGANEFAVRLFPSLCGAGCLYFLVRLALRLGSSLWAAALVALLYAAQPYVLLYNRIATLDSALTLCYLGAWWALLEEPGSFWGPGLWLAAAVLVKAWFAFFFFIPLGLSVLVFGRPDPSQFRKVLWISLMALVLWLAAYAVCFGPDFLSWEWHGNTWGRAVGPLGPSLRHHARFYGFILADLAPLYGPLLLVALFQFFSPARRNWAVLFGGLFLAVWIPGMMAIRGWEMNYLFPLFPVASIGVALWLSRVEGLLSRWPRRVAGAALLALAGLTGVKGWHYLWNPGNPNGELVGWLRAHPARFEDEPLNWIGPSVDWQAIEFYSRYRVRVLEAVPKQRPPEATLAEMPDGTLRHFEALTDGKEKRN